MYKFNREEDDRRLEGRLAIVTGTNLVVRGKILHYESGDVAILRPYILFDKNEEPRIVDENCRVENPIGVSELDCNTLEEYIKIYIITHKKKIKK